MIDWWAGGCVRGWFIYIRSFSFLIRFRTQLVPVRPTVSAGTPPRIRTLLGSTTWRVGSALRADADFGRRRETPKSFDSVDSEDKNSLFLR